MSPELLLLILYCLLIPGPPCESADVVFALDNTASIAMSEYYVQKQFAIDLSYRLLEYPDMRLGAIGYAAMAYLIAALPESVNSDTYMAKLNADEYWGGAPTYAHNAINTARQHFAQ